MITFDVKKEGSYDTIRMFENNRFKNLLCVFKESSEGYMFPDKKGGFHYFKTYDEALTAAKSLLRGDPYADAIDRINKSIDVNVNAGKLTLHLRAAEFRGYLFNQVVQLRSKNSEVC